MTDPTPQPPAWSAEESIDGMQDEMGMAQHLRLTPDQPQWIRWRTELGHLRAELSQRQQEIATLKAQLQDTEVCLNLGQQEIDRLRQAQTETKADAIRTAMSCRIVVPHRIGETAADKQKYNEAVVDVVRKLERWAALPAPPKEDA